jgi:hypothetical protein
MHHPRIRRAITPPVSCWLLLYCALCSVGIYSLMQGPSDVHRTNMICHIHPEAHVAVVLLLRSAHVDVYRWGVSLCG